MKVLLVFLVLLLAFGEPAFSQQSNPSTVSSPSTPATTPGAVAVPQTAPVQGGSGSQAASGPPPPNTLLDGTPVKMKLTEDLSSETSKSGQEVSFEVTEEVLVQGVAVIPKGAKAQATVTNAEPKKRLARGGKLEVNVDSVRLADDEEQQRRRPYCRDDWCDDCDGACVCPGGSAVSAVAREVGGDSGGDGGHRLCVGRYAPGDGEL